MRIDLGDAVLDVTLRIPGLTRLRYTWHVGAPVKATDADRVVTGPPYSPTPRKVDLIMDVPADKKVSLSGQWTDEVGNPVPAPADATEVYSVDDPTIMNIVVDENGMSWAVATGVLGVANVHGVATAAGLTFTGDVQLVVIAGDAQRFSIVVGAPVEVTPDV